MRLNKYIANSYEVSRRDADKIISQQIVKINGKIVTNLATIVDIDNDEVFINNKKLSLKTQKSIWVFYKPVGLITTHKDEENRRTVFEYLKEKGLNERVISVGRLDINSEGLLILTNDNEFAKKYQDPKNKIERVYRVRVFGNINNLDVDMLERKFEIDGIRYQPLKININEINKNSKNNWLEVTLTEGKNREIRKIMEFFGLSVNRLIRYSYGKYNLENLKVGEFKKINF